MTEPQWRISSFSSGTGTCVEVAAHDDLVFVRNSVHPDAGTLSVPPVAMGDWLAAVRAGQLDDLA
jgi:hypothetical protein